MTGLLYYIALGAVQSGIPVGEMSPLEGYIVWTRIKVTRTIEEYSGLPYKEPKVDHLRLSDPLTV